MRSVKRRAGNESGQVSIITVIAFILLFSVVVISFSRIMVAASRQTVNDELSASAKAAAESGIEDAKRILSYCMAGNTGCDKLKLDRPIEESECTTISGNGTIMTALQRTASGTSVKVGDNATQEYLCLKMTLMTLDYLGSLTSNGNSSGVGESVIIPLKFIDIEGNPTAPKKIRIQWHNTNSEGGDGKAELLAGTDLPSSNKWTRNIPAVVRAEFVAVPNDEFNINDLVANTRAVTLRPTKSPESLDGNVSLGDLLGTAYNLNYWTPKTDPNKSNPSLVPIKCAEGAGVDGYACSAEFTIPKVPSGGGSNYLFDTVKYNYYMRLQAIYQNSQFRLSATDSSGKPLYFDGIQAAVDVTGRANESLKRLGARLNPSSGNGDYEWWPDYAVDSAGKICKKMTILDKTGSDGCDYNN
ncbi:MAG: hypothetical protein LBQ11_02710 [Candidatus Nomurabacteria bacterium]|jgi:hypothetical protein|nr:hypothetical protein [Candidatus Nomurabacteria bacterium]